MIFSQALGFASRTLVAPLFLATATLFTGPVMAAEVCESSPADVTEQQVLAIKTVAGGEEGYQHLMAWAYNNLPESEVNRFDQMVECGNVGRILNAVVQLQAVQQLQTSRTQPMTQLEIVQLINF